MTPVALDPLVMAKLAAHKALGHVPVAEHAWLATHGTVETAKAGARLIEEGVPVPDIYVLFAGRMSVRTDRGLGSHKVFEMVGGGVGGKLPYSRMVSPPGDGVVDEDIEYLSIPIECTEELIRQCPVTTAAMVHAMIDRARQFKISDLRDEKLISLGKLAAGLAHELGNPASAAVRSAKLLAKTLDDADDALTALGSTQLSLEQWAAIRGAMSDCNATSEFATASAIARADRLDEITDWLTEHDADESCADALAETGITIAALDKLAAVVDGDPLRAAIRRIAAQCGLRTLAYEIEMATSRIHQLVGSVKGFTFMDHAPTSEPVDIRGGIADTFTMLASKTRAKGADIALSLPDDLPRAHAVGAELNQVWMNLIDNAVDAIAPSGQVSVAAFAERNTVVVTVTDNGPGIPREIQGKIFDPFFTTKDVGKGTGLGLDIVRRILQRHEGQLDLESEPGRTQFKVTLPMAPGATGTS